MTDRAPVDRQPRVSVQRELLVSGAESDTQLDLATPAQHATEHERTDETGVDPAEPTTP